MYLKCLRFAAAICLLTTFWSVVRISFSVFELLAPIVILGALAYKPQIRGPGLDAFKLVIAGLVVLTLAYVISSPSSHDPVEHVEKVARLLAAFLLVVGLSYVLANRRILTTMEIFYLLAFSSVACSLVAILQGQLGILSGIMPRTDPSADITRMTGLAEHPIEAGDVAAYGAVIAIGIGIVRRKWLVVVGMLAIDAYSMKYSASITAVLGFVTGTTLLCLYTKAYKVLVCGIVAGTFAAIVGASLANNSGRLAERLSDLAASGGNFGTVQTREIQLRKALNLIDVKTLLFGNGYSAADLPYKMVYFRGVDTSTLPPQAGSGSTSNKILLNFVNFESSPQTLDVRVTLPKSATYQAERIGAGDTWSAANSTLSLTGNPDLELKENLGPGESVQYILSSGRS